MLKMFQQQLLTRIISVLYVLVYLVPRQFGLLAANCDVRMRRQFKSRFWLLYSIICGCTFTISYPFAITAILSKIKTLHEGNVFIFIEISNYVALYILTVAIYVRIMFSSTKHMNYNNLAFSLLDDCKALVIDQREYEYIIPFAARVLYLYFGYATLNAITLYQNSDNLKLVPIFYKCLFFLPDIVMANTMIRQHTSIALQAICCKRINQAFSECMDVAKKIRNLSTPYARLRMGSHATQRFDKITECHAKLYKVTRETESLSAILMIFAILKAFAHLSSMVCFIFSSKYNHFSIFISISIRISILCAFLALLIDRSHSFKCNAKQRFCHNWHSKMHLLYV